MKENIFLRVVFFCSDDDENIADDDYDFLFIWSTRLGYGFQDGRYNGRDVVLGDAISLLT